MNETALEVLLLIGGYTIKATAVMGLAWLGTLVCRRQTASVRHAIWLAGFAAVLLLPLLSLVLPSRAVPVWRAKSDVELVSYSQPLTVDTPNDISVGTAAVDVPLVEAPPKPTSRLLPAIAGFWAAGFAAVLVPTLFAYLVMVRLRRRGTRRLTASEVEISALSEAAGLKRPWDLRICLSGVPPAAMTWGLVRPIVLLPKESEAWPRDRIDAVLLHELAHVRRLDSASQLLAHSACALYWFHPVLWLCARAMRAEAESAADDCVLQSGVTPSVYAAALVRIAADLGKRRQPLLTFGISVMKESKIEARIRAILNPSARRRGATAVEMLAVVTMASLAVVPLAGLRPSVFHEPAVASIDPLLTLNLADQGAKKAAPKKKKAHHGHWRVAKRQYKHGVTSVVYVDVKDAKWTPAEGGKPASVVYVEDAKPSTVVDGKIKIVKVGGGDRTVNVSSSDVSISGDAVKVEDADRKASDVVISGDTVKLESAQDASGKTRVVSGDDVIVYTTKVGGTKTATMVDGKTITLQAAPKAGQIRVYSTVKPSITTSTSGTVVYTSAKPVISTSTGGTVVYTVQSSGESLHDAKVRLWEAQQKVHELRTKVRQLAHEKKHSVKSSDLRVKYYIANPSTSNGKGVEWKVAPSAATKYKVELEYKLQADRDKAKAEAAAKGDKRLQLEYKLQAEKAEVMGAKLAQDRATLASVLERRATEKQRAEADVLKLQRLQQAKAEVDLAQLQELKAKRLYEQGALSKSDALKAKLEAEMAMRRKLEAEAKAKVKNP